MNESEIKELMEEVFPAEQENEKLLYEAAQNGCTETIKMLIGNGVDVSGENGKRALKAATLGGHIESVEVLCEAGVNLTEQENGELLCKAVQNEYTKIINKMLFRDGVDVSGENGREALFLAATSGNARILGLLLMRGAGTAEDRDRALIFAVEGGSDSCVESLLKRGADPRKNNSEALRIAVKKCESRTVGRLIRAGADVKVNNSELLLVAIEREHSEIIKRLIKEGINIDALNFELFKKLVKERKIKAIKPLLNANLTLTKEEYLELLILAIEIGDERIATLLVNTMISKRHAIFE